LTLPITGRQPSHGDRKDADKANKNIKIQTKRIEVTALSNPLRSGEHGGSFKKATLVDSGKVLEVKIPSPAEKPDSKQP
jgi:hypothetical protein